MASEGCYRFECPSCGEVVRVDDAMRRTLVETGCVVCEAPLTDESFTRLSGPGC